MKYLYCLIMMIPLICYSNEAQDNYFNNYDVIFTARYTQAGKAKRYMVEDILKGAVDKKIMSYVNASAVMDYESNAGLVLFLFKTNPAIGVELTEINLNGKIHMLIDNRWMYITLDEMRKCIENKVEAGE